MNPIEKTLAKIRNVVDDDGFEVPEWSISSHLTDWRKEFHGVALAIVKPTSTTQVADVVRVCADVGIGIVPQGGNTGLVGGQIPCTGGPQIILNTCRLNKIRSIDSYGYAMIAEAGVTLSQVQSKATGEGMYFPLSIVSEDTATIGGNLATNAGGMAVVKYGTARALCLGIEVVLADGSVWNGLRLLHKDNTGFDLRDLIVGSEGTLGIITAAVLRLFPKPTPRQTALVVVSTPSAAIQLLKFVQEASDGAVCTFELLPRFGLEIAMRHGTDNQDPFSEPHEWYVLMEMAGGWQNTTQIGMFESLLSDARDQDLVTKVKVAKGPKDSAKLWQFRKDLSTCQRYEGAALNHDIAVAINDVPRFILRATEAVVGICPGIRPAAYGHVGDGNVHFNLSQPLGMAPEAFMDLGETIAEAVYGIVMNLSGSISAEHGVGQAKRDKIELYKSVIEMDLMRKIKTALDPKNILNPGKVIKSIAGPAHGAEGAVSCP